MAVKRQKQPMTKGKLAAMLIAGVAVIGVICLLIGRSGGEKNPQEEQPPVDQPTSSQQEPEQPSATPDDEPWNVGPELPPDFEDTNDVFEADAQYKNKTVLTYTYNDAGDFISVGVDLGETKDMLYLCPVASVATPDNPVGFFLSASRCDIQCSSVNFMDSHSGDNASQANFVIQDTYDSLAPSIYIDENDYGVGWMNDVLYDGKQQEGAIVDIRAIDLNTGGLLTICRAEIGYNTKSNTYELVSLRSADVRENGAMSEADRTILLNNAVTILENKDYGPAEPLLTEDWRATAVANGIVEKVNTLYFDKCLSHLEELTFSSKLAKKYDTIYAVSIPYPETGFMTLYFSPDAPAIVTTAPLENLVEVPLVLDESASVMMNYFARDIYYPYAKQTSYTPYGYWS